MSGRRVMLSLLALLVTVSVTQAQRKLHSKIFPGSLDAGRGARETQFSKKSGRNQVAGRCWASAER